MPEQVDYQHGWRRIVERAFAAVSWATLGFVVLVLLAMIVLGLWWLAGPGTSDPW